MGNTFFKSIPLICEGWVDRESSINASFEGLKGFLYIRFATDKDSISELQLAFEDVDNPDNSERNLILSLGFHPESSIKASLTAKGANYYDQAIKIPSDTLDRLHESALITHNEGMEMILTEPNEDLLRDLYVYARDYKTAAHAEHDLNAGASILLELMASRLKQGSQVIPNDQQSTQPK